jgi:diguanylate cyclase (GGDEF)-like protein/PAS domain S-box-containing protein
MAGDSPTLKDSSPNLPQVLGSTRAANAPAHAIRRITASTVAAHAAALQEGLRLYQTMFERSALGQLIVDLPTFRIDVVNRAFCSMIGFSVDELVGSDLAMLFPAGRSPTSDIIERLADGDADGYSAQRILQRRDGTILHALATVSVVRDEVGQPTQLLIHLQDQTQKRAAEETQRRSQALIDGAIATLPMTFTAFDTHLRFTYVAGGLARVGTNPEDFLGKHISEFTKHRPTLRAMHEALNGAESTTRSVYNGQTYLTLTGPMRDDRAGVMGVISVSTNVTAEVAAETVRRAAEELRLYVAHHDALTGLPGRSALIEHLNELAWSERSPGALLVLDLDDFKLINEGLGYEAGDAVLMEVASRLSDAFPGLMVARNGGDEFAVVVASDTDLAGAKAAAELVQASLDADIAVPGQTLRVTAGVGVAIKHVRGSSSTLIGNAGAALSQAKSAGIGQYRLYDAEMRRQAQSKLAIQSGLRLALRDGTLRLAYQPIVDLVERRIIGSEALLRWTHPIRGEVPPAEFIPVAEQSGLIVPIGAWVMDRACRDTLLLESGHGMGVSVNVSIRQLSDGRFAEWLAELLERTRLPASALTLEVTESVLMDAIAPIGEAFERVRSQGVKVAIDDFGTGYSSLARLQALPVDVIKLDRAFVAGVDGRAAARDMATAILHLSAAIGADMIAEGVETDAEAATLIDLGYSLAQGYLFARPMPIEDLSGLLGARATLSRPGPRTMHRRRATDQTNLSGDPLTVALRPKLTA